MVAVIRHQNALIIVNSNTKGITELSMATTSRAK